MPDEEESNRGEIVLRVAVPLPLRQSFDYLPPAGANLTGFRPGCRIMAPFGRRKLVGFLLETADRSRISRDQLKPAAAVIDSLPLFSRDLFELLRWSADYYHHPIGEVLATAVPALLRQGKPLYEETALWSATGDPATISSRARRQRQLLEFIVERDHISRNDLTDAGFSSALLRQLLDKGLVRERTQSAPASPPFTPLQPGSHDRPVLNEEQTAVIETFRDAGSGFRSALVNGVTGSGKTEVYMRLMEDELAAGRQCLVLVPEIGLTPQTIDRFRQRFALPLAVFHSGLNDSERLQAWRAALEGSAAILIGTRSAVFTPMARPGLIVVDEEHDASFKQQEGFRYSARDLAVMRAQKENIGVVLGSATPSLESFHNAETGRFLRLELPHRAGQSAPARLRTLDIANEHIPGGLSELALTKIAQHLEAGNQTLVFINRRGYAPILHCLLCGWMAQCENCSACMTVHAQPPCQRCHHCDSTQPVPTLCPVCRQNELSTSGFGTQQLEAFLRREFPATPVLRVDRDSTRGKHKFRQLLAEVDRGKPAILIGTQMLAKGHHFPGITLAVIVNADGGLFSPDFRGQEQMAQVIVQVAGRAGRGSGRPGEVLVQTRHGDHRTLDKIINSTYSEFAGHILDERRAAGMPPFSHLCLVRAESANREAALSFLRRARRGIEALGREQRVHFTGPLPAPMEKRQSRYRMHLLLRCGNRPGLHTVLASFVTQLDALPAPGDLRWHIDVDPIDLL